MIRNLLRFVSLRHATTHLARTLLTLMGVVLGIGVFIAVRLAAGGIEASFSRMIEAVAGRAELTLTGGAGGIVEKWGTEEFVKVLQDRFPEIRHATPVIEVSPLVVGSDGEALTILGVDLLDDGYFREYQVLEAGGEAEEVLESPIAFLNSTNALLLSETFARRHGISVGDEIVLLTPLGERPFSVRGFLADVGPARGFGGNFALMQIDAVQIHFNRKGRYDRIDIATDGKTDLDELATRIEAAFGYDVRRPDFRNRQAERMMGNLELGLGMMSAMAIFVGMFLVYNTISISVVQRQREIGILRALGLPGRQARWLMLFEGGGIALFGSLAGLVFGRLIAGGILGGISRTIEKLYLRIHPGEIVLTPTLAIEGVSLGVFVAVAAAWLPAREATRIAPVETLRKERFLGHGLLPRYHRSALVGGVLFLLGVLLPHLPPIDGFPLFGFLGVYLLLAGVVLFIPRTLLLLRRGLATPLGNLLRIEGRLAADNMTRDIGRSAITIAAFMLGFGMFVAMSGYTASFQEEMDAWIEQSVPADLFINSGSIWDVEKTYLPEAVCRKIVAGLEGVTPMFVTIVKQPWRDIQLTILSLEVATYLSHATPGLLEGSIDDLAQSPAEEGVAISENLSRLHDLHRGDTIELSTAQGRRRFPIVAVMRDYTSDQGLVMIDRGLYRRYWLDDRVGTLELFLPPGSDPEPVREAITRRHGRKHHLVILTNREFKEEIGQTIEQFFAINRGIELITIVIALLGIMNTLLAAVLDRTREIGVLRAVGATRAQIRRIFMIEGGLMGLAGSLLGSLAGAIVAHVMIDSIAVATIGWRYPYHFPWLAMVQANLLAVFVAACAGYDPARRATKRPVVEALAYE